MAGSGWSSMILVIWKVMNFDPSLLLIVCKFLADVSWFNSFKSKTTFTPPHLVLVYYIKIIIFLSRVPDKKYHISVNIHSTEILLYNFPQPMDRASQKWPYLERLMTWMGRYFMIKCVTCFVGHPVCILHYKWSVSSTINYL